MQKDIITSEEIKDLEEQNVKFYMKKYHSGKNVKKLIKSGGITHYTRSGKKTKIKSGNASSQKIKKGDILKVSSVSKTGKSNKNTAKSMKSNYAFIVPSARDDVFGEKGKMFMKKRPYTKVIPEKSSKSMKKIIETIRSGKEIKSTIKDVIIVSHANQDGRLFFGIEKSGQSSNYYKLSKYVSKYNGKHNEEKVNYSNRPEITERYIGGKSKSTNDTSIHIRGCNVGESKKVLQIVWKLFGEPKQVTGPKHIHHFWGDKNNGIVGEYMKYRLPVYKKESPNRSPKIGRNELIKEFKRKEKNVFETFGKFRGRWEKWIPEGGKSALKKTKTTKLNIKSPKGVNLSHQARYERKVDFLYSYEIPYEEEKKIPSKKKDREEKIKKVIKEGRAKKLKSSYPSKEKWGNQEFPYYEYYGYNSQDEFLKKTAKTFEVIKSNKKDKYFLLCKFHKTVYEITVPIANKNNELNINLIKNGKYQRRDIKEDDDNFFRTVSSGPGEYSGLDSSGPLQ